MRTLRKRIKTGETHKESILKTQNVFSETSDKTDKNEKLNSTIVSEVQCSGIQNEEKDLVERKRSEFLNQGLEIDSEQREAMKLVDQIKSGDINNEAQVVGNDSEHLKLSAELKCKKRKCRQKKIKTPEEIEAQRLARIERQRKYRQEKKGSFKTYRERFNSLTPEQQKAYRLKKNKQRKDYLQKLITENKLEQLEAHRAKKNYYKQQYRLRLKQKIEQTKTDLNDNRRKRNKKKITEEELEVRHLKKKLSEHNFRRRRKQFEATRDNIVQKLRANQTEDTKSVESKSFELLLNQAEIKSSDDLKYTSAELRSQRYKKRKSSCTPEKLEAFKIKANMKEKKYREQKKAILKKSLELLEHIRELSAEEKEVLKLAEKIKHQKLKISERRKKRLNEKRNALLKETIEHRQTNTKDMMEEQAEGSPLTNHQPSSSFPFVEDEIEIEKKVVQQTLIKAIPKRLTETLNDSSCSWLQPSQESFSTDGTQTSHFRYFHGDSTISESFLNGSSSHHSNKIERRKTVIDESFSCMRAVIDTTTKGDRFVMFGKHIAQKMRSHKKAEAEINIAKLLIDNVLQNLSIGIYKSEM